MVKLKENCHIQDGLKTVQLAVGSSVVWEEDSRDKTRNRRSQCTDYVYNLLTNPVLTVDLSLLPSDPYRHKNEASPLKWAPVLLHVHSQYVCPPPWCRIFLFLSCFLCGCQPDPVNPFTELQDEEGRLHLAYWICVKEVRGEAVILLC